MRRTGGDGLAARRLLPWLLAAVAAAGCAGPFATGRRDDAVARAVKRHEVLPDYRYYVHPGAGLADALLGVRRDWRLEGPLWREVAPTPELLRRTLEELGTDRGGVVALPPAQAIVAPDGTVLGFWVSVAPLPPARIGEGRTVAVPLPGPIERDGGGRGSPRRRFP